MSDLHPDRIKCLNDRPERENAYVLYWMQQSMRVDENHALHYAIERAQALDQPVIVGFGLMDDYPEANLRHYVFMLEGLHDVAESLKSLDIKFVLQKGAPADIAVKLGRDASLIVCDRGYLRHQRQWRDQVADQADCQVVQVESDLVVPIEVASQKREYAARTIRKKIMTQFEDYLDVPELRKPPKSSLRLSVTGEDLSDPLALARSLKLEPVPPVDQLFTGGTTAAKAVFRRFLDKLFSNYSDHRNQPQTSDVSHMSKYLHFGMISPVWLVNEVRQKRSKENVDSFVEEVLVRRELAANFCYYTENYDHYSCLPDWAQKTLKKHKHDDREHVYTRDQLENAETHDPYWNAAMREMKHTGYMHNYMRMYWGKKIVSWTNTPEYAYETLLYLNNKYFLDGRDFNSFANVAWVFGNHDRPWQESPVYGTTRRLSTQGLERKTKPTEYVKKVDQLVDQVQADN
ncbi:deoxyribodipyrimidine photo-lyase [Catalinimonas alkaloidigena]|uniref:Deoxyribodipyrimidine photo-lyase n=1 Tax=Catalinimonas alkaloidigena TaxID=1075417 RepID=A0A1G9REP8_9BACT|nr:deoxyribodipyrimidine photo-lyase [Catalinimonas alkaloidigena]SDM21703.1 deoxyribodipyrimidine photo-lyase [Catalinimonas alkaloidigena]